MAGAFRTASLVIYLLFTSLTKGEDASQFLSKSVFRRPPGADSGNVGNLESHRDREINRLPFDYSIGSSRSEGKRKDAFVDHDMHREITEQNNIIPVTVSSSARNLKSRIKQNMKRSLFVRKQKEIKKGSFTPKFEHHSKTMKGIFVSMLSPTPRAEMPPVVKFIPGSHDMTVDTSNGGFFNVDMASIVTNPIINEREHASTHSRDQHRYATIANSRQGDADINTIKNKDALIYDNQQKEFTTDRSPQTQMLANSQQKYAEPRSNPIRHAGLEISRNVDIVRETSTHTIAEKNEDVDKVTEVNESRPNYLEKKKNHHEYLEKDVTHNDYLEKDVTHNDYLEKDENQHDIMFVQGGKEPHNNDFKCKPCSCSKSPSGMTNANCTFRHLRLFPLNLPSDVRFINMTGNKLKDLNFADLSKYQNLTILDVTFNNIVKVRNFPSNGKLITKMESLIFNRNQISQINPDIFISMKNLKFLYLQRNNLHEINKATFQNLKKLKHLDLSYNEIKSIDNNTFVHFLKLQELFLNNNGLFYSTLNPLHIQHGLIRLRVLRIQKNAKKNDRYPNYFLSQMKNLRELYVDGLKEGFGPELKNLSMFKKLVIGPNCFLKIIPSTYFQNVPYLKCLVISYCKITSIDPAAFNQIPHLQEYRLYHVKTYDLMRAFEDLSGLQNSSLKYLGFVRLYHRAPMCRSLSAEQGKFIQNLTLRELDLSHNRLAMLRLDFLDLIPRSLEQLTLANNKLTLDPNLWNTIGFLINLRILDVSYQNTVDRNFKNPREELSASARYLDNDYEEGQHSDFKFDFPRSNTLSNNSSIENESRKKDKTNSSTFVEAYYENGALDNISPPDIVGAEIEDPYYNIDNIGYNPGAFILSLPPNLTTVKASHYTAFGDTLLKNKLNNPQKLIRLDFRSSFITNWGTDGSLPKTTQWLDLSDNYCSKLLPTFFPNGSELVHLRIQQNLLGESFHQDKYGRILQHLNELRYLDISANSIFSLPELFFKGLHKLTFLKMTDNKLQVLKMNISVMPNLPYLDLSKNSITWIARKTRQSLDSLGLSNSLVIDLQNNYLPCSCNGIEILKWMAATDVTILNLDYFKCLNDKGIVEDLGNIDEKIKLLETQCTSYMAYITGGAAGGGGFILSLLLAILIYKRRWHIMYSVNNSLVIRLFGFKPKGGMRMARKFDAYVVYEEDDRDFVLKNVLNELETKRGHRLCVDDRDFIPGTFTFNNIVNAVENSTVTIFVISPDFVNTNDFDYAIQMALLVEYHGQKKREVCRLLIYRPTPAKDMSKDLQMLLAKGHFLEYPQCEGRYTQELYDNFWDKLSSDIGHTTNYICTETDEFEHALVIDE